jgi:hypothetical protein
MLLRYAPAFIVVGLLSVGSVAACDANTDKKVDADSVSDNSGWYSDDVPQDVFDVGPDAGDVASDALDVGPDFIQRDTDNSGWYGDDVPPGPGDVGPDASEGVPDVLPDHIRSDNSGWYGDDGAPIDSGAVIDGMGGELDGGAQRRGDSSLASAGEARPGDELLSNGPGEGLDWTALAWCAPEKRRAGLRAYRGVQTAFAVEPDYGDHLG